MIAATTFRRSLFATAIAFAAAAHVDARTVLVHVASSTCSAATLRATSTEGATIERRWSGGDVSFDLGGDAWTISAIAPGCWAASADAGAATVTLKLWPAATLHFRVQEPRDVPVQLRLSSADGKIAPVANACTREDATYTCSVPAIPLDLRLGADGFVPLYVWGKEIAARSRVDLGAIRLARGASVSGRVTMPLKEPKLDGATVHLAPGTVTTFGGSGDSARRALMTQTAKTNRRGFFQFAGVPEGNYTVVARAEGWSPATENDVRVVTGAEIALPRAMALSPLATVDVVVDPPTDAGGKPWHIKMVRTWPQTEPPLVVRGTASPAGDWSGSKVEGGRYDVSVDDAAGSKFYRQFLDVAEGMSPLHVSIDAIRVRGRVTFRGEPLECGVTLMQPVNAKANIRLRSDKEGKFEAVLPEEGTWRVQLTAGKTWAHLPSVEIRRHTDGAPVELALALPGGRIRGKTVDENGDPVVVGVEVWKQGDPLASTVSDGNFDVVGVEPADVTLRAYNDALDRDSGTLQVHVTEAGDDPLTVVVSKRKKVKSWLATPDGHPIAGALVRYVVADTMKEAVSGPGGEVVLAIPPGQAIVPLVILSSGLPRKMMTLTSTAEPGEIVLSPIGARLLLQHTPRLYFIAHDGVIVPSSQVFEPSYGGRPRESTGNGWALDFEPGAYAICATYSRQGCKSFTLQAGTTTTVDVSEIVK